MPEQVQAAQRKGKRGARKTATAPPAPQGKRRTAARSKTAPGAAKERARAAAEPPAALPEPDAAPRLGMLEEGIAFYLRIAQDASFRSFARRTGQMDIRPGAFAAMEVIGSNPGITASALGRAIARDKSTVTPLIQYLQRRRFVTRSTSTADRRRLHLKLTAAGQKTLRNLQQHAGQHDAELDAIVGRAKPRIIKLLQLIADRLNP